MAAVKQCIRCSGVFELCFFKLDNRPERRLQNGNGYRSVCKGCESEKKFATSRRRTWHKKAQGTLRRHAKRYIERGLVETVEEFIDVYKWDAVQMAHEAEHAYSNGCGYCTKAFAEMGMGTGDLTLDIVEPLMPPLYGINTRWVCKDCNTRKAGTPHAEWIALQFEWEKWTRHRARLAQGIEPVGFQRGLFEVAA